MTWDEVQGEVDNSLWFEVYSHTLQRVGEAVCGGHWLWPKGKAQEIMVSPIVRAFWEEVGIEPAASCTRLCWELMPRAVFKRMERGAVSYAVTFLDDMAVCTPMLDAWDQFVWPPSAATPRTTMQGGKYGYCHQNAINLGAVMPATEFRVTDEEGTHLCKVHTLIFEGSILAYDPAMDEAEWVPTRRVTNNLSQVEERMAVTLANFVPCTPHEADHIAELGICHLLAWTDSSSSEDDEEPAQEEDGEQAWEEDGEQVLEEDDEHEEMEGQGKSNPKVLPHNGMHGRDEAKQGMEPRRRSQEWASIMDEEQPLTFDDLQSDSDHSTLSPTPLEHGLPEDVMEVHALDLELQAL